MLSTRNMIALYPIMDSHKSQQFLVQTPVYRSQKAFSTKDILAVSGLEQAPYPTNIPINLTEELEYSQGRTCLSTNNCHKYHESRRIDTKPLLGILPSIFFYLSDLLLSSSQLGLAICMLFHVSFNFLLEGLLCFYPFF